MPPLKLACLSIFVVIAAAYPGCTRPPVLSFIEDQAPPAVEPPAVPRQVEQCLRDEAGNRQKILVIRSDARLHDLGKPEQSQQLQMGDLLYLFGRDETKLIVGFTPRNPEGSIPLQSGILVKSMVVVSPRSSSALTREAIPAFASVDQLRDYLARAARPSGDFRFTRDAGSVGRHDLHRWLPVIGTHDIKFEAMSVKSLEVASWTLRPSKASAITAVGSKPVKPKTVPHLHSLFIVFCLDATGSMHPCFEALKQCVVEIAAALRADPSLDVQIGFVLYRDHEHEKTWLMRNSPFTNDLERVKTWVGRMGVAGGGDDREQMFMALEKSNEMLETLGRPGAYKVILVCADQPGHTYGHIEADKVLGDVGHEVLDSLQRRGVVLHAIQCPSRTNADELRQQLKILTSRTRGSLFKLQGDAASLVAEQMINACRLTAKNALLETKVAKDLEHGLSRDMIAAKYVLPPATVAWTLEHLEKRGWSLPEPGRFVQTPLGHLGIDRAFLIADERLEYGVLMRRSEGELLVKVIDRLLTSGLERREALTEIWTDVLGMNLGESDVTISEALRVRGLPVRDGLLSISLGELLALPHASRRQWAHEVEAKYAGLAKALQEADTDGHGNIVLPMEVLP